MKNRIDLMLNCNQNIHKAPKSNSKQLFITSTIFSISGKYSTCFNTLCQTQDARILRAYLMASGRMFL